MYQPHQKQVSAHRAFLVDGYKRGVLLMGRQCLVANTLVATPDGYTHIEDLQVGDEVLSSDGYKKIINTWQYGVDTDPKPMIQFKIDEETITCTYDHKFYLNGKYVPAYQFAWRAMAASERSQLKLLCEQYGQPFDDQEAQQRGLDISDEASFGHFWVSKDGYGRQDNQGTQDSRSDLVAESAKQTRGKSHRREPSQQPDNKFGVGDTSGKYFTYTQDGESGEQAGRELRDAQAKRTSSLGDSSAKRENELSSTSRQIQGIVLHDTGHNAPQNLVSSVTVHTTIKTYAIDVEDTHDYCITAKNILVGNSGKTYFATQHSWLSAAIKQGRYFVVFKTYKQAHEVVWRQYVPLIPKQLIYKKNEQDLLIELHYIKGDIKMPWGEVVTIEHDENKPRSTIQLLGSDQSDSHRGFKADGIIFDEYADQSPDNWDAVYKHFFTTTNGWAIFMGTPRGYNHFYDLIQFAQENDRWFYQKATWRDSPYVSEQFINEEKQEAEKRGTLSTFMQEVELEFRAVQGAVFPSFNRDIHIIKPEQVPPLGQLSIYIGMDFGYHTTAVIFAGIDKDDNWYIFDEVYGREEQLEDVVPRIRGKLTDQRLVLMVGDSQAKDAIMYMNQKGFPIVPVTKYGSSNVPGGSIAHGIDLIRQKLKPRQQLIGFPKPSIFFASNCKNLIQEIEAYKYPEEKKDRNPSELPVKENDHGPDALRYLVLHLRYGVQKEDKFPKQSSMIKETNSYGLL